MLDIFILLCLIFINGKHFINAHIQICRGTATHFKHDTKVKMLYPPQPTKRNNVISATFKFRINLNFFLNNLVSKNAHLF